MMGNNWIREFIDLVFPKAAACMLCLQSTGKQHFMELSLPKAHSQMLQSLPLVKLTNYLCERCLVDLQLSDGYNICSICGRIMVEPDTCNDCHSIAKREGRSFLTARSTATYSDKIKLLIHNYKYHGQRQLLEPLSILIFYAWEKNFLHKCDVLVPVPLHTDRLAERSFNQAMMLAKKIQENYNTPVADVLVRTQETEKQSKKTREQRMQKLTGFFTLDSSRRDLIRGKKVVIVDDIYTTGTTADACAEVLLAHGAIQVDILTIAR